jgi:DNA repair exonuclease SbcCD nuclease subunit
VCYVNGGGKMKIAHIADTHIKNLKYHDDYRSCFEQMYEILREQEVDYIIHCGDIAHTKTRVCGNGI